MITEIRIHALKSIKNLKIDCKNFNLLAGTNSSGKSTIIHALLLVKQYLSKGEGLNGSIISLGELSEVRNFYSLREEPIEIELKTHSDKSVKISFSEDEDGHDNISIAGDIKVMDRGFHYLSCHRIGAMDIYEKKRDSSADCGIDGEYALGCLQRYYEDPLPYELVSSDKAFNNTLLDQVNYWMHRIVGTTVAINDIDRSNYLQVFYSNNPKVSSMEAGKVRPINVGSGISYIISIIITCLLSKKDDIIIIENPEIHLHPKAQSELCKFLYFIAHAGRQLFVETHSDHIFNGLRVGIVKGTMSMDEISICFLALNNNTFETMCNPIEITKYGDLQGYNSEMTLKDLFDQFSVDLDEMLGL